jgi:hypothetical protein
MEKGEVLSRADRVFEAFQRLPLSESERTAVKVVLGNPGLSSEALSRGAKWGGKTWQMIFGKMCGKREALLWPAPDDTPRPRKFRSGILVDFDPVTKGFKLKPEAIEAFARLGL